MGEWVIRWCKKKSDEFTSTDRYNIERSKEQRVVNMRQQRRKIKRVSPSEIYDRSERVRRFRSSRWASEVIVS